MARRPQVFGQRRTISQGLAGTRRVNYDLAPEERAGAEQDAGKSPAAPAVEAAPQELPPQMPPCPPAKPEEIDAAPAEARQLPSRALEVRDEILNELMDQIDIGAAAQLDRDELTVEIRPIISEILVQRKMTLNLDEQTELETLVIDEMVGLGPLEPLLKQDDVTDIMVNGAKQVYVERNGKLELSGVTFRDDDHVMNLASRIVTQVGRRIDQTTPLVDARLKDGSRVNVIVPPLAIRGPTISIRKFSRRALDLDTMVRQGNLSPEMATVLRIAAACRLNILVSGGTGSGKTTLLNAMSQLIDPGERIVTVEDAAELQLQQPHVVALETRPASIEGSGAITIRDLVRNALRMRPDRIIVGEIRGEEAIDMLQAMNTGHDGSMGTLHANRPRDALTRLENMVNMGNVNLPLRAIRQQIAEALDLIVHVSRMRDGKRRIVSITEVVDTQGDIISTQELFRYHYEGETPKGELIGRFESGGLHPHFFEKARYFGMHEALIEALGSPIPDMEANSL